MKRPRAALALLLAAAAAPAGVRGALGPRYGGEISLGLPELPEVPVERPAASLAQRCLGGLQHETLLRLGPGGEPWPALATGWSSAASGREWTLRLHAAASFHDGQPVTADAAVRSLRRFLRAPSGAAAALAEDLEGGRAYRAGESDALPGLAAAEPGRVVLRLREPRARPLAPLAAQAAAVTGDSGAGAGPFVPTLRLPARVTFTAFAGHVRGRPLLDVVHVALAEERTLETELRAGRLDLAPGDGDVRALSATLLLILDPGQAPLAQPEDRAAVAAAIDAPDLVRNFLRGGEAVGSLLPASLLPPLADAVQAPARPLAGALELAVSRDVAPLVSQRVVARLGAAGLSVRVRALDPAAARSARATARLLLWQPELPEPGLALEDLESLAPSASARAALAAARAESDPDRRRALLYRAEAALREAHVLVPLATAPTAFHARPGLHGARVDLAGRLVLEDAWLSP